VLTYLYTSLLTPLRRCGEDFKLGGVFLINDVEEHGINGNMAVHVDHKVMVQPHEPGGAGDANGWNNGSLGFADIGADAAPINAHLHFDFLFSIAIHSTSCVSSTEKGWG